MDAFQDQERAGISRNIGGSGGNCGLFDPKDVTPVGRAAIWLVIVPRILPLLVGIALHF